MNLVTNNKWMMERRNTRQQEVKKGKGTRKEE
jgi:hypothetical protein